jgi:DNA-binding NarL/FixJ family response regulator
VITTEGSEAHVVQVLSLGARGYIRKPFTPDQVREHVIPLVAVKAWKMPGESPTSNTSDPSWVPMLEVAAREVFELMLSCKLTVLETPTDGTLEMRIAAIP